MASKQEQRERLRRERLAAERRAGAGGRGRLILGYAAAGVLGLAVVVGLVIVLSGSGGGGGGDASREFPEASFVSVDSGPTFGLEPDGREGTEPPPVEQADLQTAAQEAGCELDLELPDEGSSHVTGEVEYDTNPPTSGDHNPDWLADGAYAEQPDDVNVVHSMEHGRVEIQYSPELAEDDQLALKGVFEEDPSAVLFFPNAELPEGSVAVTAWTNMMTCDGVEGRATLDAVRAFRDDFRGRYNPESVPLSF